MDVAQLIQPIIDGLLPKSHPIPEIDLLYRMMRDYPNRGGKMIRSGLLLASSLAHGGTLERALPVAAALELFQNWILIHDDIEDDSDERRGLPALHKTHGMPLALNAGDAMHVYMWRLLQQCNVPGVFEEFLTMIDITAEGQHMDLSWVTHQRWDIGQSDYLELVKRKTARYTVVSPLRLGALAAGLTPNPLFEDAGNDLGVAFQIRDDVLNLVANQAEYGKEIAGDLWEGKRTLMLVHLLEVAEAKERTEVLRILNKARHAKTPTEIDVVLGLMRRCGSIDHAQGLADEHATRGLKTLQLCLQNLPNQDAAKRIFETARGLATRTA